MLSVRRKKAEVDIALRRGRETTYTEPLLQRGQKQDEDDLAEVKTFLYSFFRTIYRRREECHAILRQHPNTVALHFANLVPDQMSYEDFWQRYFFRCDVDRLLDQWDRRGKQLAAARAESVQRGLKGLQTSLKGLQATVATALEGEVESVIATPTGDRKTPRVDTETPSDGPVTPGLLTPILGPDISINNKENEEQSQNTVNQAIPLQEIAAAKGEERTVPELVEERRGNAPTVSGETSEKSSKTKTAVSEEKAGDVNITPSRVKDIAKAAGSALSAFVEEANKIDQNTRLNRPQKQRNIPPVSSSEDNRKPQKLGEPQVVSFWQHLDDSPETVKKGSLSRVDQKNGAAVAAKATNKADTKPTPAAELQVTDPPSKLLPTTDLGADKNTKSVTLIVLLLLITMVGMMVRNPDLHCSPAMPGLRLTKETFVTEAPWWAPQSLKQNVFSALCPAHPRVRLDWTRAGGGKDLPLYQLVATDVAEGKRIFQRRNLQNAKISLHNMVFIGKNGESEEVKVPWTP